MTATTSADRHLFQAKWRSTNFPRKALASITQTPLPPPPGTVRLISHFSEYFSLLHLTFLLYSKVVIHVFYCTAAVVWKLKLIRVKRFMGTVRLRKTNKQGTTVSRFIHLLKKKKNLIKKWFQGKLTTILSYIILS